MARGRRSSLFQALWNENRYYHLPLVFTLMARGVVVCLLVFYMVRFLVPFATPPLLFVALLVLGAISFSRPLRLNSIRMERVFMDNLNSRELQARREGKARPGFADHLLARDMHLADFEVPADSSWGGCLLRELNLGSRYNVHVVSILRGTHRINIPKGDDRIFPGDRIQVIGTDEQVGRFSEALGQTVSVDAWQQQDHEMQLKQYLISDKSGFIGEKLKNSGIRNRYHCMIVGFEGEDGLLEEPDAERVFRVGDILWVVGEKDALKQLFAL